MVKGANPAISIVTAISTKRNMNCLACTLQSRIKENLNEWKDITCHQLEMLNFEYVELS